MKDVEHCLGAERIRVPLCWHTRGNFKTCRRKLAACCTLIVLVYFRACLATLDNLLISL